MNNTPFVTKQLKSQNHPLHDEIQAVRKIIMDINKDIAEEWKWNAPSFSYKGNYMVTFNLRVNDKIHLVFHNDNIPKIKSKLLEGDYKDRRMTYFSSMNEIKANKNELERIIKELIKFIDYSMSKSDIPKTSGPALRALSGLGIKQLKDLTKFTESDIKSLHGMGPKAFIILKETMNAKKLSFKD